MFGSIANWIAQSQMSSNVIPDLPMNNSFNLFDTILQNQTMFPPQLLIPNPQEMMLQIQIQKLLAAMNDVNQNQGKIPTSPPIKSQNLSTNCNTPLMTMTTTNTGTQNPRKRPSSSSGNKKSEDNENTQPKRSKQLRKMLAEDTETNSPVSGMYIKELSEVSPDDIAKAAELDETASYVHISEESRKKIQEIPNVIGDSICSLCKVKFDDVFKLAMHKCPRIVHEEYKCPECDKIFSCPANLASHRRWHGPRTQKTNQSTTSSTASLSPLNLSTRESSPTDTFQELLLALTKNNSISSSTSFPSTTTPTNTDNSTTVKQEINIVV